MFFSRIRKFLFISYLTDNLLKQIVKAGENQTNNSQTPTMDKKDKRRIIKDFDKLDESIQEQIKLFYPEGFDQSLIHFTDKNGNLVSALPFETDDIYYLVRMTVSEARAIISDDDDYDDEGFLKEGSKLAFEDKYGDLDSLDDDLGEKGLID
jgi:hypothetical protein